MVRENPQTARQYGESENMQKQEYTVEQEYNSFKVTSQDGTDTEGSRIGRW